MKQCPWYDTCDAICRAGTEAINALSAENTRLTAQNAKLIDAIERLLEGATIERLSLRAPYERTTRGHGPYTGSSILGVE